MNRPPRTPPPGAVGALLAVIGFGIAAFYGWHWYQLPAWSERDIAASVDLNLALDRSRAPQAEPLDAQAETRQRAQVRKELETQIAAEREEPRSYTFAGLIMGMFGLVQMALRTWLARSARR